MAIRPRGLFPILLLDRPFQQPARPQPAKAGRSSRGRSAACCTDGRPGVALSLGSFLRRVGAERPGHDLLVREDDVRQCFFPSSHGSSAPPLFRSARMSPLSPCIDSGKAKPSSARCPPNHDFHVDEAAEYFAVSVRTVYRLIGKGRLNRSKIRGCPRVPPEEIRRCKRELDGSWKSSETPPTTIVIDSGDISWRA